MKVCSRCNLTKPLTEFRKWYTYCKQCLYKQQKEITHKNIEARRIYWRKYQKQLRQKPKPMPNLNPIHALWIQSQGDLKVFTELYRKLRGLKPR